MLVELAYQMRLINEQTFQKYMMFALNLAYATLKNTYLKMTTGR
jgi:hypothetical protein